MVPLAGVLYTALFAAMSALRREGISAAFVAQSLAITAVFSAVSLLAGSRLAPLAFVLALYLLTMRVRILLDLGSLLASRGRLGAAERVYDLALALLPSSAERCIVAINRGVCRLLAGDAPSAARVLLRALEDAEQRRVGVKYLSAGHYNLGIAYVKQGKKAEAAAEMLRVIELWPVSEYARRAEASLRAAR